MIEVASARDTALDWQRSGDHDKAAALLRDVLKHMPDHPDALHLPGFSLHAAGQHCEALFHANAGTLATGGMEAAIAHDRVVRDLIVLLEEVAV